MSYITVQLKVLRSCLKQYCTVSEAGPTNLAKKELLCLWIHECESPLWGEFGWEKNSAYRDNCKCNCSHTSYGKSPLKELKLKQKTKGTYLISLLLSRQFELQSSSTYVSLFFLHICHCCKTRITAVVILWIRFITKTKNRYHVDTLRKKVWYIKCKTWSKKQKRVARHKWNRKRVQSEIVSFICSKSKT